MYKSHGLSLIGLLLISLALCSCSYNREKKHSEAEQMVDADSSMFIVPKYAKGFSVSYLKNGIRLVEVRDPQTDEDERMPIGYAFALVSKGSEAQVPEGYERVKVPIRSTITMTSLQLSNFTALSAHDFIRGITGTKNLFNEDILQRVKDGRIQKIGMEGDFDVELILAANPDIIFISPFKRGGYDTIKETGITLVPHLGYKEATPLAQAEWVKFVAMFIGRETEANAVFDGIAQRYNEVKALAEQAKKRPTVFSGEMHGGNWYAVGGKNHLAQMFRDAGADYIVHDDNTGGVNMEYEQLYATAANADYWRILNSFPGNFSYDALLASEPRNALFRAFRERHVIYCNMRQRPYYESAPVEPDQVLTDLVAIFHPELLPNHEGKYYKLLK